MRDRSEYSRSRGPRVNPLPAAGAADLQRQRRARRRARVLMCFALSMLVCLVLLGLSRFLRRPTLSEARSALGRGEFGKALQICEVILQSDAGRGEPLLVAGRASQGLQHYQQALEFFERVPDDGSSASLQALGEAGELYLKLGSLSAAEDCFRRILAQTPDDLATRQQLVHLFRLTGRNWEALPHVHELFRRRVFTEEVLEFAGLLEMTRLDTEDDIAFLVYCNEEYPQDPLPQLGLIRTWLARRLDVHFVRDQLLDTVNKHPELIEAQAQLGQLLWELNAEEQFAAWHAQLPKSAEQHPLIWATRGQWAYQQGDAPSAIRALGEALQRSPNERAANLLLARLLVASGRTEEAAAFQQRGDRLLEVDDLFLRGDRVDGRRTAASLSRMIVVLEELGRFWEALGWCRVLRQAEPDSSSASESIARLEAKLGDDSPLTEVAFNPALKLDLAQFPLPDWSRYGGEVTRSSHSTPSPSAISFQDVADDVGLDFTYFVDRQRMTRRVYTFDFAGGGVGVLDYDLDAWPDIYLTQSRHWPAIDEDEEPRDGLFRNHAGNSFQEVAALARIRDSGFGHGPAVGDFNGDGFPDLYVTNIGANALYLNCGDGTFVDYTDRSGTAGDEYSLSAALADFSGDGWPDLYVTNYLGADALSRQCTEADRLYQCPPTRFPGQQDRLYLNLGDGRFSDVTEDSGIVYPDGKCMGVLALDLNGDRRLDVYVANDTQENLLFINYGEPSSTAITMREEGSLAGVAYDDHGRLQGSMGIAACDVNGDRLLDLFVTNFSNENNNLFQQLSGKPLLFDDRSLEWGLATVSIDKVGWGAQFLDAELDGDWDLVLANGRLEETPSESTEAAMLAQVFEHDGAAQFVEVLPSQLGPYFATRKFGRAVARLDWNRDGLDDFCVTHRGAPVALLTNTSRAQGHWLGIQLRGVNSSRDAIGAELQITAGDRQWITQLMSGDGFEASNERRLLIGLGANQLVEKLTIHWPSGLTQEFQNLPSDQDWLFIEGRSSPLKYRP